MLPPELLHLGGAIDSILHEYLKKKESNLEPIIADPSYAESYRSKNKISVHCLTSTFSFLPGLNYIIGAIKAPKKIHNYLLALPF
jgi:hypothetical protein